MYSNDQTQIRMGLVNYLGSLLKTSPFEGKAGAQNVVAILTEEALKLAQSEEGAIDFYIIKPLLKGTVFSLKQRTFELSKLPKSAIIEEQINNYKLVVSVLEQLISSL